MLVWDKKDTTEILEDNLERNCPEHRIPHILPMFKPDVDDEPCHIHQTTWRQEGHHEPFCKYLKCPHYNDMLNARRKYLENNSS